MGGGGGGKGPIEQVEGGKITRENSPWLGGGASVSSFSTRIQ